MASPTPNVSGGGLLWNMISSPSPKTSAGYTRVPDSEASSMDILSVVGSSKVTEDDLKGFSGEEPPSQPRITRPITLEFEFQYSHDEDDTIVQTNVSHATNPSTSSIQWSNSAQIPPDTLPMQPQLQAAHITMLLPDNVLKHHHKKNSQLRLPDPETLELMHQVKSDDDQPTQPSKTKRLKMRNDWAKAHSTSMNPFPALVTNLLLSVCEVLVSVFVAWDRDGKQFEARNWLQQKSNMARLLYDDLATWWSNLKKSATSLAPHSYSLIPPPSVPPQEHAEWIKHTAAALLNGSLFLRFGLDECGKTRNFAHPALLEGVIIFYYTGPYRIARRRPDIFRNQLPVSCLALVGAAVYNCVLDSLAKNGNAKYYPKFTAREYGPIYAKMVQMLNNILQDQYHGLKLLAQLREWAEAGWRESFFGVDCSILIPSI
ncbi:hypothetical protein EV702DRAFT_1196110 [Suillus placidus]|uniref:DUF6532 domain-containing protein n=1 Tax=Suillus placidus TaxID=48579 RepID=A0A9P6ZXH6_9AGAM|nr:hypothetical protein EV702DRAFT_1196110 [Suillus placidus]